MAKDNYMEFTGTVENLIKDKVIVKINDSYSVMCTVSGKMRQAGIKLMPLDVVSIEVSAYDTTKGRVVFRHK